MEIKTLARPDSDLRQSEAQAQLKAAYRQVFGNAHLFDDERSLSAESLWRERRYPSLQYAAPLGHSGVNPHTRARR